MMNKVKKIIGIFIGTMFVGLGVALYKLSSVGQDSLSAMVFSIMYLFDNQYLSYTIFYISINAIFLFLMIIFLRKEINIGTIINLVFTGIFSDLFIRLFLFLNLDSNILFIKIFYGILGVIVVSFGIALYGGAGLGIAPYDGLPLVLRLKFKKLSYRLARIIIDLFCTFIALLIGVIILKRYDIINFNTLLSFLATGPLIAYFSKIFSKYIYKEKEQTFN